jgi:tetratricopeptide (TPR) repeat protein
VTLTPPPHLRPLARRCITLCCVAMCCLTLCASLAALPAFADDLEELSVRISEVAKSIDSIRNQHVADPLLANDPDARLQEGLLLLELGDPTRASVIFLDIVSNEAWTGKPAYSRAHFLLARSLYESGNHHTARRWLKRTLQDGNPEDHPAAAALLIDLTLRNKRSLSQADWDDIERIYQQLSSSRNPHPELLYARGKALYARSQYEAAENNPAATQSLLDSISTLSSIDPTLPVGLAARYFAGACRVHSQDLDGALSDFQTILDQAPSVDSTNPNIAAQNRDVIELAHIARARIFYERKQWTDALASYSHIPRSSRYFDQVMFEIAWLHIAQKDLPMALRHIDILLLSSPDSVFMPDAKRLRADLLKSQGDFSKAIDTYEELLTTFDPIVSSLNAMVEGHPDHLIFFQNLVASSLDGSFAYLPSAATQWLPPDERMLEAIGMVSSLAQSRKNTEEINLIIREIEAAIESDNRYQLFPGLREAWVNALSIENRILSLHRDLNLLEADLLSSSPQLTAATSERLASEKLFLALPQNRDEHQLRSQRLALELEQRKLRAYRLRSLIESSDAKVSAIDQWLRLNITKANFDAQQETDLRAGLASARADITSLTAELREAEHQLRILDTLGGLDAGLVEHENNIRQSFKLSLRRERDAMQPLRSPLPDLQRIDALRADLDRDEANLDALRSHITAAADTKIAEVRRRIASEKSLLPKYASDDTLLRGDVQLIAGAIAHQHWQEAISLFTDLVLASDMGVIDVAWLKKEATSDKLDRLKEERSRENDVLRQDFEQVLRESGQSAP